MWSLLRAGLAVLAGALVSILLAYLGGVMWVLATLGIPLGATPREPTPGEYLGLILIALVGAVIGGRVAARVARHHRRAVTLVLAATLGIVMLRGFSAPASQWPGWWAPAIAAAFAAGACLGGLSRWGRTVGIPDSASRTIQS